MIAFSITNVLKGKQLAYMFIHMDVEEGVPMGYYEPGAQFLFNHRELEALFFESGYTVELDFGLII